MELLSYETVALLFIVALTAGFIDTIAGGGGLLTIPALLYIGLPPSSALATNKLQGTVGTLVSSFYFIKNKLVDVKEMKWMIYNTPKCQDNFLKNLILSDTCYSTLHFH